MQKRLWAFQALASALWLDDGDLTTVGHLLNSTYFENKFNNDQVLRNSSEEQCPKPKTLNPSTL